MSNESEVVEQVIRQGVTLSKTTNFDIRVFALEKAVQTHGFSHDSSRINADDVVKAAGAYEDFLRNGYAEEA